ncbi:MAG: hypothetical protein JZU65_05345 [Chlorobium sp.]|nr:hypothetical protein [Chlorobium sp.]
MRGRMANVAGIKQFEAGLFYGERAHGFSPASDLPVTKSQEHEAVHLTIVVITSG